MPLAAPAMLLGAGRETVDSRVDPAVAVLVDVQNTLVVNALLRWGTDDLRQRYLPRLATDTVGAYALSESGSGSDAFALLHRTRRQREGVAARSGFRQGVCPDGFRRDFRKVALPDVVAAPAEQRVDEERVLNIDEDANRRIDARQRFDSEQGVKEGRAAAAECLGDLDPHDAEVE